MSLSSGFPGVEPALDTVDSRHEHRGEGEVRIAGRIGEAHFYTLGLRRRRVHGDTHRGGAIATGRGEIDRRFETWNQPAVGICTRVGEGGDRRRVMKNPGDVVERHLGHSGVTGAREQRRLTLPYALMGMHAGAVIAKNSWARRSIT
jgi:hypothetical protein